MLLQTLLKNINTIVNSAIIKYNKKATDNETLSSARVADYYMGAEEKLLTFWSFDRFSTDAIINSGMPTYPSDNYETNTFTVSTYAANKKLIPEVYRDAVVNEQIRIIVSEYEFYGDGNNYYRELAGLPPTSATEKDYIKLTPEQYEFYNIDPSLYVYQIPDNKYRSLVNDGVMDEIIKSVSCLP